MFLLLLLQTITLMSIDRCVILAYSFTFTLSKRIQRPVSALFHSPSTKKNNNNDDDATNPYIPYIKRVANDIFLNAQKVDHDILSTVETTAGNVHHFNNAGSSPPPFHHVTKPIVEYMMLENLVGGYEAESMYEEQKERAYDLIAELLQISSSSSGSSSDDIFSGIIEKEKKNARNEIALCESATVAWTRIFYSMVDKSIPIPSNNNVSSPIIMISEAEYAANVVAIQKVCIERNTKMCILPSIHKTSGIVDIRILEKILEGEAYYTEFFSSSSQQVENAIVIKPFIHDPDNVGDHVNKVEMKWFDPSRIKILAITHIPTNSGIINPVNEIGVLVEQYNNNINNNKNKIYYLVDACQSIGQIPVDAKKMKCHALSATGRKYLRGPRGTGFLYVQYQEEEEFIPSHIDHAAVPLSVNDNKLVLKFKPGCQRFEFWESNIANKIGLGKAVEYALKHSDHLNMTKSENNNNNNNEQKDEDLLADLSSSSKSSSAYCERNIICRLGELLQDRLHGLFEESDGIFRKYDFFVHHHYKDFSKNTRPEISHQPNQIIQSGIVTFGFRKPAQPKLSSAYIKSEMKKRYNFMLSIVPPTSTPFDSLQSGLLLGNDPKNKIELIRASLTYFNTEEEIELFCKGLEEIIRTHDFLYRIIE